MKALSYIVASILMLIITVALSGTAYMYMSGVFTAGIQGIEIADAYCSLGEVTFKIKNIGTSAITGLDIEQTNPQDDFLAKQFSGSIEPGKTIQYIDICTGEQSRKCIYRITPPAGKTLTSEATCSGRPASLVAAFHFDEGSGTIVRGSAAGTFYGGNFNDAELMPNYPTNAPKRVDGKYGKALEFDGIDDYVLVSNHDSLSPDKITIGAWINLKSSAAIFRKGPPNNQGAYSLFMGSSYTRCWLGNGSDYIQSTISETYLNGWYHLACTFNGTHGKFYANGVLKATDNFDTPTTLTNSTLDLSIGSYYNIHSFANGTIDEVRIYGRALTQEEIQADMQSSVPITTPIASWSFEESGQYVNDTHIWIKGKYGNALSFDGVDDYVELLDDISLNFGTSDFTTEVWIKTPTIGATHRPAIAKSGGASQIWYGPLILSNTGKVRALIDDGPDVYYVTSTNRVDDNEWNHIVCVFDRDTKIRMFINGVEETVVESGTITDVGSIDNSVNLKIAHRSAYFLGIIDEVRIYNKAII